MRHRAARDGVDQRPQRNERERGQDEERDRYDGVQGRATELGDDPVEDR